MQNHTQLPARLSFSYETERLILRLPSTDYAPEILDFLCRNRSCFQKYEPTAPENYYTLDLQQSLARYELKLALKLSSVRFYVFLKEDPSTIIGTVCLHDIIKMPYFSSELGYKFDASYHHHGYAREALSKVLAIGFYDLGLHRIFGRCMPENVPSRKLLAVTGFFEEGIERGSILIQGKWEDHIRYAILNPGDVHS
ncbi:MAG: GNAT family N-acetyltransferase [Roseburia inulinivorans]